MAQVGTIALRRYGCASRPTGHVAASLLRHIVAGQRAGVPLGVPHIAGDVHRFLIRPGGLRPADLVDHLVEQVLVGPAQLTLTRHLAHIALLPTIRLSALSHQPRYQLLGLHRYSSVSCAPPGGRERAVSPSARRRTAVLHRWRPAASPRDPGS